MRRFVKDEVEPSALRGEEDLHCNAADQSIECQPKTAEYTRVCRQSNERRAFGDERKQ